MTYTNHSIRLIAVKFRSINQVTASDYLTYRSIRKIVGIVETNWPDEARSFAAADPITDKIGQNVADFLAADMKRGIIPSTFLPLQSGVGNIANAVLGALGRDQTIPAFEMYTEVIQNSVIGLIREGRVKFGSACSLTVTNDCLQGIYDDMDFSVIN